MKASFLCLLLLLLAAPASAQTGRWLTASGNLEIDIAPCGDALCGTVARVVANHSMSDPTKEAANPATPGMKILVDFTPDGENTWYGHVFDRENGKTYRCRMSILSSDQLAIHPYIGVPLFGKTQIWRRVLELPDHK